MQFSVPGKVDDGLEAKLVVQALRINTLSKLTYSDSERFDALLRDVFPGVEFRDIEYETLREALKEVCAECHLGIIDSQVRQQTVSRLSLVSRVNYSVIIAIMPVNCR